MERITKYQKPDAYKAERKAKQKAEKAAILAANNDAFLAAHKLAKDHGIVLTRFTGGHFRLLNRKEDWVIDIWPAKRRIVSNMSACGRRAPKVVVGYGWTLLDIIESICGGQETG